MKQNWHEDCDYEDCDHEDGDSARVVLCCGTDRDTTALICALAGHYGYQVMFWRQEEHLRALQWATAAKIVVDVTAVPQCLELPARDGIVVSGTDPDDGEIFVAADAIGARDVVVLPQDRSRLVEIMAQVGARFGLAVGVIAGSGGAGASTLAAALAVNAARGGFESLLVDADPLGGGVEQFFGAALGYPDQSCLGPGLPGSAGLSVMSWQRDDVAVVPGPALAQTLTMARQCFDLCVVDMPRKIGDELADVAALLDLAVVVVPVTQRAGAAAARVAAHAAMVIPDLRLVARGPDTSTLTATALAASLGLDLVAHVRNLRNRDGLQDYTRFTAPGRGSLLDACAQILAAAGATRCPAA